MLFNIEKFFFDFPILLEESACLDPSPTLPRDRSVVKKEVWKSGTGIEGSHFGDTLFCLGGCSTKEKNEFFWIEGVGINHLENEMWRSNGSLRRGVQLNAPIHLKCDRKSGGDL